MSDESRRARVNRNSEGRPVGCAVFLSVRQLRDLGLDPETIDAIEYAVTDGDLRLEKLS